MRVGTSGVVVSRNGALEGAAEFPLLCDLGVAEEGDGAGDGILRFSLCDGFEVDAELGGSDSTARGGEGGVGTALRGPRGIAFAERAGT